MRNILVREDKFVFKCSGPWRLITGGIAAIDISKIRLRWNSQDRASKDHESIIFRISF
jgi:hypothetical protein